MTTIINKLEGKSLVLEMDDMKEEVVLTVGEYAETGAVAVNLRSKSGIPWGSLTVNVEGTELAEDEILVKTWTENAFWARQLITAGFFEDTGKRIQCGFCDAEIWKVK